MNGSLHLDLLGQLLPEVLLVLTALGVLLLDVRTFRDLPGTVRMRRAAWVSAAGLAGSGLLLFFPPAAGDAPIDTLVLQPATQFLKGVLILLSLATVLMAAPARFTRHAGEFFALIVLATVGLLLLVGTANLLMLFIALELVSLSLYVMTAFQDDRPESTEAALKYFLFGGLAAAVTLFGFSLLYGIGGSLQLSVLGPQLSGSAAGPLLWTAMVMVIAGLGFKIALAPFHLWAPDVYQAAPPPVAAFIASGSKIAGFMILARVLHEGMGSGSAGSAGAAQWVPGWIPVISVLATASMLVGNITAIQQTDLRRLLAYSAVAQAGYGALGLLDPAPESRGVVLYFAVTYAIAVLGTLGVVATVDADGRGLQVEQLAGLGRRSPFLGTCLTVFILSLAGIPPLAGFFGKFFVFVPAISRGAHMGRIWIVAVAVATSAIALYYYLQILKHALISDPGERTDPLPVPTATAVVLTALAVLTLVLGCCPDLLLAPLR